MTRSESEVPSAERYLALWRQLSSAALEREVEAVTSWSSRKGQPVAADTLAKFLVPGAERHSRAVVVVHCYADLALPKAYEILFRLEDPVRRELLCTEVVHALFWSRLAQAKLEHGHHQIALLQFPSGVPAVIESLPVDGFGREPWAPQVGLCSATDYPEICEAGLRRQAADRA